MSTSALGWSTPELAKLYPAFLEGCLEIRRLDLEESRLEAERLQSAIKAIRHALDHVPFSPGPEDRAAPLGRVTKFPNSEDRAPRGRPQSTGRLRLDAAASMWLRKHGYPPDKQEKATQTVLEQAAVLSEGWAA